jgi:predicted amidohydrolase YtcJ
LTLHGTWESAPNAASAAGTLNAARLTGETGIRGTLTAGRLADLTIWDRDPGDAAGDELRDLIPTHTIVGGRLVHGAATG